jgi:hypothetical protein
VGTFYWTPRTEAVILATRQDARKGDDESSRCDLDLFGQQDPPH